MLVYLTPDADSCPEMVKESIREYLDYGVPPGGFVTAVLENNLIEAFGRADDNNAKNMHHIAAFIYNRVPRVAWGSPEIVEAWINGKAAERRNKGE